MACQLTPLRAAGPGALYISPAVLGPMREVFRGFSEEAEDLYLARLSAGLALSLLVVLPLYGLSLDISRLLI